MEDMMPCRGCGGTKFYMTQFYYLWLDEVIDLSDESIEEVEREREYMDAQSGWECATKGCWEGPDEDAVDKLEKISYDSI